MSNVKAGREEEITFSFFVIDSPYGWVDNEGRKRARENLWIDPVFLIDIICWFSFQSSIPFL